MKTTTNSNPKTQHKLLKCIKKNINLQKTWRLSRNLPKHQLSSILSTTPNQLQSHFNLVQRRFVLSPSLSSDFYLKKVQSSISPLSRYTQLFSTVTYCKASIKSGQKIDDDMKTSSEKLLPLTFLLTIIFQISHASVPVVLWHGMGKLKTFFI